MPRVAPGSSRRPRLALNRARRSGRPWPSPGSSVVVGPRSGGANEREALWPDVHGSDATVRPLLNADAPKIVVVMPALNAAPTLQATVEAIPKELIDDVILVDDGSHDTTVELARSLGIDLIWHPHTAGYGANQKTCYLEALQRGADAVVMLHPDGQYEPALIPKMCAPILAGEADLVLGSRLLEPGTARRGGMPRYKL